MGRKTKVLVIGGGPGGYVAAIRAAQLGGDVVLVEKAALGGTCLNVGCIPTKALLHAAEFVRGAAEAKRFGIHLEVQGIDWEQVMLQKQTIVDTLVKGVDSLLAHNHVRVIKGCAHFAENGQVSITTQSGTEQMQADKIILAVGSRPAFPPIDGLRESVYGMDSTSALSMENCPDEIIILGGGVIGVEFACAFQAFGCKTTILEALPQLIPPLDKELSSYLSRCLRKQGIQIHLNTKVVQIMDGADQATVLAVEQDGTQRQFVTKHILVALGRRPNLEPLQLERVGVKTENGHIVVNQFLQTSVPNIYAIGDCVKGSTLAHTASAQGECAAEHAMGMGRPYQPAAVPACVYAFPEVAFAGLTEEQAKERNIPYHVGRFPFSANGRSLILNQGEGMVKVLVGDELNEILGVHIIGPNATEMIAEAVLAIEMEGTSDEVIEAIHAHPTASEALREAFLASESRAIHVLNRKKEGVSVE